MSTARSEDQFEPKRKRRPVGLLLVLALVLLGGIAAAYFLLSDQLANLGFGATPTPTQELCVVRALPSLEQVESFLDDWDDANQLARSTSRISLSPAIGRLQEIRREVAEIEMPECGDAVREPLLEYMDKTIEGYLAFMADEPDADVAQLFEEASEKLNEYSFALLAFHSSVPSVTPSADKADPKLIKALRGHWVTESGETHYYFSDGRLLMVDQGDASDMRYVVLESDGSTGTLTLQVENLTTGLGHTKVLKFADDRKSLIQTTALMGVSLDTSWSYVDDATEP